MVFISKKRLIQMLCESFQVGSRRELSRRCGETVVILMATCSKDCICRLRFPSAILFPRGSVAASPDVLVNTVSFPCFHFVVGTEVIAKSMLGKLSSTELPANPG